MIPDSINTEIQEKETLIPRTKKHLYLPLTVSNTHSKSLCTDAMILSWSAEVKDTFPFGEERMG